MSIEGELLVRVHSDAGCILRTDLVSTRTQAAARLLVGRTPSEAAALVSRLYSICGRAQGITGALACEAAMASTKGEESMNARRRLVAGELAVEGLWRALIDWPEAAGLAPQVKALATAREGIVAALARLDDAQSVEGHPPGEQKITAAGRAVEAIVSDVLQRDVLGIPVSRWNELATVDDLASWSAMGETPAAAMIDALLRGWGGFGASAVGLLPPMNGELVERELAQSIAGDPAFSLRPRWRGAPAETGPLARMRAHLLVVSLVERFGRSSLTRIVARLVELCALASGALPEIGAKSLGRGSGIAWVETSRGLLVHRVEIAAGRIQDYRIVAPTEWNFHAEGPLARGLEGAKFEDESALRRGVRLLVQSLDPCVAWKLEVGHA